MGVRLCEGSAEDLQIRGVFDSYPGTRYTLLIASVDSTNGTQTTS